MGESLIYLLGAGGLTTIVTAMFGWRSFKDREREDHRPDGENQWMMMAMNNLARDVQETRRAVDGNTKALSDLTIQVNHMAYIAEKK